MWSGADVDPRVALLAVRLAVPLAAGSNDVSMVPGMCREAAAQGRCNFVTNMINLRRLGQAIDNLHHTDAERTRPY
jgi:hypothetical protein